MNMCLLWLLVMFNDVVNGHDIVNGHDVSLSVSCDSESDRKLSLSGDRFELSVEVIYQRSFIIIIIFYHFFSSPSSSIASLLVMIFHLSLHFGLMFQHKCWVWEYLCV